MADPHPDPWMDSINAFLTYCRRTWGDVTWQSQRLTENFRQFELPQFELPGTSFLERLHSGAEIPERCKLFLGCLNILTVALVVALAMEDAPPGDIEQQLQKDGDQHDQHQTSVDEKEKQDESLRDFRGQQTLQDEILASIQEEPETSEGGDHEENVVDLIGARCGDCRAACADCKAIANKTIRLLTECGYCGGEEHTVRPTDCRVCGGLEHMNETINVQNVESPSDSELKVGCSSGGDLGETLDDKGNFKEDPVDLEGGHLEHPTGRQIYWRNRVLDILAPSLPPLPDACTPSFADLENMNGTGNSRTSLSQIADSEGAGDGGGEGFPQATGQTTEGGPLQHETAHDRSHENQDYGLLEGAEPLDFEAAQEMRDDNSAAPNYHTSTGHENVQYPTRVQAHLPASVPSPRPRSPDYNSRGLREWPARGQYGGNHSRRPSRHSVNITASILSSTVAHVLVNDIIWRFPGFGGPPLVHHNSGPPPTPPSSRSPPPHGSERVSNGTAITPHGLPPPYGGFGLNHHTYNNQPSSSELNLVPSWHQFGNNGPFPEYYYNNHLPQFHSVGATSHNQQGNHGPSQASSSDDDDDGHEVLSQSSRSPSSRPNNINNRVVPSHHPLANDRPWLAVHTNNSISHRERCRSRPRGRVLARRPRCGLMMVKALREDPSCVPEEGKGAATRQPGHEDKLFSPKRGDVILRHMILPGRGVVEVYFPGLEEHLQDGDSLVRLKMDNVSYPTMLIIRAKAYVFLQGRWMYLGRHQHGVRKPKTERILGRV